MISFSQENRCAYVERFQNITTIANGEKQSPIEVQFDTFRLEDNEKFDPQYNIHSLLFTSQNKQNGKQGRQLQNSVDRQHSKNTFFISDESVQSSILQSNKKYSDSNKKQNNGLDIRPFQVKNKSKFQSKKFKQNQVPNYMTINLNLKQVQMIYQKQIQFLSRNNQQLFAQIKKLTEQNNFYKEKTANLQRIVQKYSFQNQKLLDQITESRQKQNYIIKKWIKAESEIKDMTHKIQLRERKVLQERQINFQENIQQYKVIKKINQMVIQSKKRQKKDNQNIEITQNSQLFCTQDKNRFFNRGTGQNFTKHQSENINKIDSKTHELRSKSENITHRAKTQYTQLKWKQKQNDQKAQHRKQYNKDFEQQIDSIVSKISSQKKKIIQKKMKKSIILSTQPRTLQTEVNQIISKKIGKEKSQIFKKKGTKFSSSSHTIIPIYQPILKGNKFSQKK